MNTFYSIIYATIRADISEKISIGLVFVSDEKVYFRYSNNKVNLLKHLLPSGPLKSVKEGIKNIDTKFNHHKRITSNTSEISFNEKLDNREFSLPYLDYLSNYNNNLITFSKPAAIDIELNTDIFNTFYKKFVDEINLENSISNRNQFELFRKEYFKRVIKQFNIDVKLTSREIPNLLVPVKFDLVGKNERAVVAEFVNTESTANSIINQFNNFYSFRDAEPNSKRFLVASEPDKKLFPEQHDLWAIFHRKNDLAEYVEQKDAGLIEEYATEHGVIPLLSK